MKKLAVDIESFSSVDLSKCGVYRYASSPDFDILLFGYSVDGGEVRVVDLAFGEEIPADIMAVLSDDYAIKWSYNNNFERVALSNYFGTWFEPGSWHCTMVWAAYLGLPRSLAEAFRRERPDPLFLHPLQADQNKRRPDAEPAGT